MMESKGRIPGFVWTAALALIPLLVQWLQGEYFGAQTWVSVVVIILGGIAKLIEVYRTQPPAAHVGAQTSGVSAPATRSTFSRFLWGG